MKIVLGGLVAAALCASASGAVIATGMYQLHNHPDGNALPPAYGLRLDELYNATSGHDIYTFDFSAMASNVQMAVTPTTIHIYGQSYGGRDIGGGYAADIDAGVYSFSFVYNIGVQPVAGDDDIYVLADMQNTGWISTPRGDTIALVDKSDGNYSFRLGDEDNDAGHRGFNGISGWGWLNHGGRPHVAASDWLFTAELVPAPSAMGLLALAGVAAGRRRR